MNIAEADATYLLDAIRSVSDYGFNGARQYLAGKGYYNRDGEINANAVSVLSGVVTTPLLDGWEDSEELGVDALVSGIVNLEGKGQYAAVYVLFASLYAYMELELPLDFIAAGAEDGLLKRLVSEIRMDVEDWYMETGF